MSAIEQTITAEPIGGAEILPRPVVAPLMNNNSSGRIEYLDSLRGLAALYVVLSHVVVDFSGDRPHPIAEMQFCMRLILRCLDYGKLGVSLFIVLSGYCLMLPIARGGGTKLRNGFRDYIMRRWWRIYPPYLAAMAVSLIVLGLLPRPVLERSFWMTTFTPAFSWQIILSHLFLVHNLDNRWLWKINAPFWSVATEWQIYFLFPSVLLPLARKFGVWSVIPAGLILGLMPMFIFRRFETAGPWLIGLFGMGMFAAAVVHSPGSAHSRLKHWRGWGYLCVAVLVMCVIMLAMMQTGRLRPNWKYDCTLQVIWGVAVMAMLIWLPGSPTDTSLAGRARGVLLSKSLRNLGTISYSLYLIHAMGVGLTMIGLTYVCAGMTVEIHAALALVCATFMSLLFAVGFYAMFERPFVLAKKRVVGGSQP